MDGDEIKAVESCEPVPPGLHNAYGFALFNALSFPIVVGSPMILYAKSLDATATILGIIAGMMPLLVILQIPAARHVPRFGYKRFVYSGWGIRTLIVLGIALVPLLGVWLGRTSQLGLLLLGLFGYNFSRGISSCAWLPWITAIVPESHRGRYLAGDAAWTNLGNFAIVLGAALWLGADPGPFHFAIMIGFAAVTGGCSLIFLKRIPEVEAPEEMVRSGQPVPWRAIVRHPPFRQMLRFGVGWAVTSGGLGTFTVAWLKTQTDMTENAILAVTSVTFLGGLSSLVLMSRRLDRFGSKPALALALFLWLGIGCCWSLLALERLDPGMGVLVPLHFVMGLAAALVGMAVMRQVMGAIPQMGRSHFFAIYSVVTNVTLGLAPVFWGVLIDVLRRTQWAQTHWGVGHYAIYFTAVEALLLLNLVQCASLHEPAAIPMNRLLRDIVIDSPQRLWVRFWPRR
ncbi:MAG: hypothetical protein ISQ14_11620 [Verrucomicrobiae bacterium]|nr:hypothetical protein [Verrucomicrobiae bacterium]